ncbi:hypothetical protein ACIRRA_40560 [Nocardia sp. NPDC101769]|uniref:hypothetical protein n=1 Tax=Nocardia sp. NPDC101769 TaxID=3364333 RepID=UPI003826D525
MSTNRTKLVAHASAVAAVVGLSALAGRPSRRKSDIRNARPRWTRIGMRLAIGAAALVMLPFSARVASAAGLTAGFDPGPSGGYKAQISGLSSDDKCEIWFGNDAGLNGAPTAGGNGSSNGTLTFGPVDVDSNGYTQVAIRCTHKDGSKVFDDYFANWDSHHEITLQQGGPDAAPVNNPLGTQWSVSDTGGAPQPWIGNWTQQPDGTCVNGHMEVAAGGRVRYPLVARKSPHPFAGVGG